MKEQSGTRWTEPGMVIPARIDAKIERTDSCWNWTGALTGGKGYGSVRHNGHTLPAHRVVYEILVGPVPFGLTLDHLCRNRRCVRPSHLEPVSNRENILRGEGVAAQASRRTHAPCGHPYNAKAKRGDRFCFECERDKHTIRQRERRSAR